VLIKTAIKTKIVKKIIRAKIKGGISISPKETMNKSAGKFIITKNKLNKLILNQSHIKIESIK
tara:strand:- start:3245 stop:3433 length:189 start_codon:yes stop_codon:yes gene_type:complete